MASYEHNDDAEMDDIAQPQDAPPPVEEAPAPGSYAALRAAARSGGSPPTAASDHAPPPASASGGTIYAEQGDYDVPAAAAAEDHTAVPMTSESNVGGIEAEAGPASHHHQQDDLGAPAFQSAARNSMAATQARAGALASQGQARANAAAADAQARAAATAEHGAKMAVVAADVARQQFEARWNDVLAQERQLAVEAQRLEKYERQLLSMTRNDPPNFPPKMCCCIEPVVFHNIMSDIGQDRQGFVKTAWFNYWFTCVLLVYNFGLSLSMMFVGDKDDEESPDLTAHLVISIIMLVGVVMAFVLWYWPLYRACATGSSGQHVTCYIGLIVAFIFNIIVCIGPVGFGGCGLLYGLELKTTKGDDPFYAILVNVLLFAGQTVYFGFAFYRMKCKYGAEDKASIAAANAEMARDNIVGAVLR